MTQTCYDLIIVGAGASGLTAALEASKGGLSVLVIEKNPKAGRKLLATGNGRCNLSNHSISFQNYNLASYSHINLLLNKFQTKECIDFFNSLGVLTTKNESGKIFPLSLHAKSIAWALYHNCLKEGASFLFDSKVISLKKDSNIFLVSTKDKQFKTKNLLIATGGAASPKLGGSELGLEFAKNFGHKIEKIYPSLVQLKSSDKTLKLSSGVKLEAVVTLMIDKKRVRSVQDDLLFRKDGLSGLSILALSKEANFALEQNLTVVVSLDLLPTLSKEALLKHFKSNFNIKIPLDIFLSTILNPNLIPAILSRFKLQKNDLKNDKKIREFIHFLKNWEVKIDGNYGFESAEVMAGGVSLEEIDEKTYESKIVKNLYFSGEVLNVDGDCGGYNLHFAWGSGIIASKAILANA